MSKNESAKNEQQQPAKPFSRWVDKQDILLGLNISSRTLQDLRSFCNLPYYKIGGKIYYDSNEVNEMVAKNSV